MMRPNPYSRLLLPVDTLESFTRVVPLAGLLIRTMAIGGKNIDLLHVIAGSFLRDRFKTLDLAAGEMLLAHEMAQLRVDHLQHVVEPLLDRCRALIRRETGGEEPGSLIRDGDPAKVISSICHDRSYATVIMGRRRSIEGSGSVTDSVVAGVLHRHAGATVYLVGDEPHPANVSPFARCLIGVDDSPASHHAVAEAALLLPRVEAQLERVVLVHVLDQSCYYDENGDPCSRTSLTGQRALEAAGAMLVEAGVDPRKIIPVIHFGRPASVLVEEALSVDATMIFIGRRDRSRMAQLYLGSVCTDIVQNCRDRVLVLTG